MQSIFNFDLLRKNAENKIAIAEIVFYFQSLDFKLDFCKCHYTMMVTLTPLSSNVNLRTLYA